jgi:4-hydroxy 2-oxovalerate aldolase
MSLNIVDSTLRDGMHSVAHQFTPAQMAEIASLLDRAGVGTIEVSHGDGLAGSSIQYGEARASDEAYLEAVLGAVERASVAVLLLPGVGTLERVKAAQALGASTARIATHCTEADIAQQHIGWCREQGMRTIGFLMMSHMVEPAPLADQAALMEEYGAEVVYVVDSAGALLPDGAAARVTALRERLACEVGFHAHNNLGCAIGNALAAAEAGASWLDGSLCGLGAGAGNAQTEVLCAALTRAGYRTDVDAFALSDGAEEVVIPLMPRPQVIDRAALALGFAGVYSSFLLHAERAAEKYDVDARDVLVELGRRRMVGGQEDMIIDVAAAMAGEAEAERGAGQPT